MPAVLRYLQAMRRRIDRLRQDLAKDLSAMDRVHAVEDVWHEALDAVTAGAVVSPELAEVGWMIEELRVSLFAQSLGTAYPVSEKRVLQTIASLRASR
jgi:ATP-dependent helicase HrpA